MPSNRTIAKQLKRVVDYREICGEEPGNYTEAAWIVQSFTEGALDALYKTGGRPWSGLPPSSTKKGFS